jgi:hypothetical protein
MQACQRRAKVLHRIIHIFPGYFRFRPPAPRKALFRRPFRPSCYPFLPSSNKDHIMMKTCLAVPLLCLASLASAAGPSAPHALPPGHPSPGARADIGDVRVAKAAGPGAKTVEEIVTQRAALKDQTVTVRGKIVKFNSAILGKNWIHLQDGTGSPAEGSHDVLVTTQGQARPGDVVTARGTVRVDKDFGSGYAYRVLIEDASVTPDKGS